MISPGFERAVMELSRLAPNGLRTLMEFTKELKRYNDVKEEEDRIAKGSHRLCAGCDKVKVYDADTWGNIAEGKGLKYGCPDCVKAFHKT